jgi:hypothetical protein
MSSKFFSLFVLFISFGQLAGSPQTSEQRKPLAKSPYWAFVDREYIFTIEMAKPGIPILNFVSMINAESKLQAKNIQLDLENRKCAAKSLAFETGQFQQSMLMSSITMKPRSSLGLRIECDLGATTELIGATIRIGDENFALASLNNYDFENLALKINRINLGSPDFSEDWRVLKLEMIGTRSPARKQIIGAQ